MKKSLVALGILAAFASTAAFADVKITGTLAGGYIASNNYNAWSVENGTTTGPVGNKSGFGIQTSQINFLVTEDLGNGLKFKGQLGLQGADRSGANDVNNSASGTVTGGDSFLTLESASLGSVSLTSTGGGSYLGSGIPGVAGYDFSGNSSPAAPTPVNKKNIGYTGYYLYGGQGTNTAVVYKLAEGPVTFEAVRQQPAASAIGTGVLGQNAGQTSNLYALSYKAGQLQANVGFGTYDSKETKSFAVGSYPLAKGMWRAAASYDFGVAKVGAGYINQTFMNDQPAQKQWLLGVAVPVGPLTLGAEVTKVESGWASQQAGVNDGTTKLADMKVGTQTGVAYTANYALSKQTSLKAAYARWQQTNTTAYNTSEMSVILSHSF